MCKFRNKKDEELLDSLSKCRISEIGLQNVLFDFVDSLYFNKNKPIKPGLETVEIEKSKK